jgi:hypothetical protein
LGSVDPALDKIAKGWDAITLKELAFDGRIWIDNLTFDDIVWLRQKDDFWNTLNDLDSADKQGNPRSLEIAVRNHADNLLYLLHEHNPDAIDRSKRSVLWKCEEFLSDSVYYADRLSDAVIAASIGAAEGSMAGWLAAGWFAKKCLIAILGMFEIKRKSHLLVPKYGIRHVEREVKSEVKKLGRILRNKPGG